MEDFTPVASRVYRPYSDSLKNDNFPEMTNPFHNLNQMTDLLTNSWANDTRLIPKYVLPPPQQNFTSLTPSLSLERDFMLLHSIEGGGSGGGAPISSELSTKTAVDISTYNTGDESGYKTLHPGSKHDFNQLGKTVGRNLAQRDILCLQESFDALENGWFSKNQFEWIGRSTGEAIAWDRNRFTLVKDSIMTGDSFIAVDLFDKNTKKVIRIASIHFTGYCIEKAETNDPDTLFAVKENAKKLAKILEKLNERGPYEYCLIGSDTNSDPARYDGVHQVFTKQNFKYKPPETPTNYHVESDQKRTLDYVFYTNNGNADCIKETLLYEECFELNNPRNPSDHRPVNYTFSSLYKGRTFLKSIAIFIADLVSNFFAEKSAKEAFQKPADLNQKITQINIQNSITITTWGRIRHAMLSYFG